MNATQKLQYDLSWERIFGGNTPYGNIFLLPSEAQAVIIQYDPDFRISCLIPPKKRQVRVEWMGKETSRIVNTPLLLMTHLLYQKRDGDDYHFAELMGFNYDAVTLNCKCRSCLHGRALLNLRSHVATCDCEKCSQVEYREHILTQLYHLFAVEGSNSSEIIAQPYRLTNVYEDGKMCFRKQGSGLYYPQNLRQAHSSFWMHRFDNDFNIRIPHKCNRKYHGYRNCILRNQRHACDGDHEHIHTCDDDVDDDEDIVCKCCEEDCSCYKTCPCCASPQICNCSKKWATVCTCKCCRDTCNCRCDCDLSKAFAEYLENYQPDFYKWENYTQLVCGNRFFAAKKNSTGVFVSNNSRLKELIPKKYWRNSSRTNASFLLGTVDRNNQGLWEIDLGNLKFFLKPEQIRIIG